MHVLIFCFQASLFLPATPFSYFLRTRSIIVDFPILSFLQDFQNRGDFVLWVTIVQREPATLFPALQELTIISPRSLFAPFAQRVTTALKIPPATMVSHVLLAFIVLKVSSKLKSFFKKKPAHFSDELGTNSQWTI